MKDFVDTIEPAEITATLYSNPKFFMRAKGSRNM